MSLGAISWDSKKQPIVSLLMLDSEYVSTTATTCQVVWMRRMLKYLWQKQEGATTILQFLCLKIMFSTKGANTLTLNIISIES